MIKNPLYLLLHLTNKYYTTLCINTLDTCLLYCMKDVPYCNRNDIHE